MSGDFEAQEPVNGSSEDIDLRGPFFYSINENGACKQAGPVNLPRLIDLSTEGVISPKTLIWTKGLSSWVAVQDAPKLFGALFGVAACATKMKPEPEVQIVADCYEFGTNVPDKVNDGNRKSKRRKRPGERVSAVYVTGLPQDTTEEELAKHFSKLGPLQKDILTGMPCVKMYMDEKGKLKGDAVVVYLDRSTMLNAVMLLDDAPLRPEMLSSPCNLHIEEAYRQPAFAINGLISNREGANSETVKKALKVQTLEHEQALSWDDDGVGAEVGLKIVVLYNLFDVADDEISSDPKAFRQELENDLLDECSKIGHVKKVTVFLYHPEAPATVKFRSTHSAAKCVRMMNGRTLDGRIIRAEFWDGSTDFRRFSKSDIEEREKEDLDRLDLFAADLERSAK